MPSKIACRASSASASRIRISNACRINPLAAMPCIQPVEQSRACTADMEVGQREREQNERVGVRHG